MAEVEELKWSNKIETKDEKKEVYHHIDISKEYFAVTHRMSNPFVIIIGVTKYNKKWKDLPEVKTDIDKMKHLWQKMFKFDTKILTDTKYKNGSKRDILNFLEYECRRKVQDQIENETRYDGLVCIVSSHGILNGSIISSDGQLIDINKHLFMRFNAENVKKLANYPKIFIFDAYRQDWALDVVRGQEIVPTNTECGYRIIYLTTSHLCGVFIQPFYELMDYLYSNKILHKIDFNTILRLTSEKTLVATDNLIWPVHENYTFYKILFQCKYDKDEIKYESQDAFSILKRVSLNDYYERKYKSYDPFTITDTECDETVGLESKMNDVHQYTEINHGMSNPFIIIIGVTTYNKKKSNGWKYLPGITKDVKEMRDLWQIKLKYTTEILTDYSKYKNCSKRDILNFLHECQMKVWDQTENKIAYDGLICIVSAHGIKGSFVSGDGQFIDIMYNIVRPFNDNVSKELINYPKIFIFDTDHGCIPPNIIEKNRAIRFKGSIHNRSGYSVFYGRGGAFIQSFYETMIYLYKNQILSKIDFQTILAMTSEKASIKKCENNSMYQYHGHKEYNSFYKIFFQCKDSPNDYNKFVLKELSLDDYNKELCIYQQQVCFNKFDTALSRMGCNTKQRKQIQYQSYNRIIKATEKRLKDAASTTNHKLLSKTKTAHVTTECESKSDDGEDFKKGHFNMTLDFKYKQWMSDEVKWERMLKEEICEVLHGINPSMIEIVQVTEGSVSIDWIILNVWMPTYVASLNLDPISIDYEMRLQDQIEVEYNNNWYPATIVEIRDKPGIHGKYFKVRYNAQNGKDIFWKNTEWFWSQKQASRLHVAGTALIMFDNEGVRIDSTFTPPPIAADEQGVRVQNVTDVMVGYHIYINHKNYWYRCEVINKIHSQNGISIDVIRLVDGLSSKTNLRLWDDNDLSVIALDEMRE